MSTADSEERLILALLPVVDSLDRALGQMPARQAAVRTGLLLIRRQLLEALAQVEVVAVPAQGLPFDPRLHEAVAKAQSETLPPGTIAKEHRCGFARRGQLLRPAEVTVVHRERPGA